MRKRYLIVAGVILILMVTALAGNTLRNRMGWQPLPRSPAEAEALLAPAWRLRLPEGEGPFKAAILLSGCDGVHDNMDLWADQMVALGRAALILDSHGPRGFDQMQAWRAVCAAQILPGAERAGDLAVAMAALARMPQIDSHDMAVLGASHGGWSAMEFLGLLKGENPPPGLTDWPAPPETLAASLGPVILLYPYCGVVSGAGDAIWPKQARGLMVLAEKDSIVDPQKCREMADKLAAQGAQIEIITLAGADHGFDQKEHSILSTLQFDQKLVDETRAAVTGVVR